jgi:hypothetical protein
MFCHLVAYRIKGTNSERLETMIETIELLSILFCDKIEFAFGSAH